MIAARCGRALTAVLVAAAAPTLHASQPPVFCGVDLSASGRGRPLPPPQLRPHDEAGRRPDFVAFRATLRNIVARRDVAGLLKVVAPDVGVAFDGARGIDAFKQHHLLNPKEDFWAEFGDVLAHGGSFRTPDAFDAPYTFSEWPATFDAFQCMAIVGTGVHLRNAPRQSAPASDVIDFALVEWQSSDQPVAGWELVRLADGREGYVATRYLRSPLSYRATFTFKGGQWWLAAFVVGD